MNPTRVALALGLAGLLGGIANAYTLKADVEGHPIRWFEMPVRYTIDVGGARDLGIEVAERAVVASFDAWNHVDEAVIELEYAGRVAGDSIGYDRGAPESNHNLVVWSRDAWNHEPEPLAITITTFRRGSGMLVDADVFVNERHYDWGEGDSAVNDLQNAITHEAGHFLGLGHSEIEEATMYASAAPHEISKRTLETDDRAGVAVIYPLAGGVQRPADAPPAALDDGAHRDDGLPPERASTTRGGVASGEAPQVPQVGCAAAPGAPGSPADLTIWLMGVLAFLRRRQR